MLYVCDGLGAVVLPRETAVLKVAPVSEEGAVRLVEEARDVEGVRCAIGKPVLAQILAGRLRTPLEATSCSAALAPGDRALVATIGGRDGGVTYHVVMREA